MDEHHFFAVGVDHIQKMFQNGFDLCGTHHHDFFQTRHEQVTEGVAHDGDAPNRKQKFEPVDCLTLGTQDEVAHAFFLLGYFPSRFFQREFVRQAPAFVTVVAEADDTLVDHWLVIDSEHGWFR